MTHSMSYPHCYHREPLRASRPDFVIVRCCGRRAAADQHAPHTREVFFPAGTHGPRPLRSSPQRSKPQASPAPTSSEAPR